MIEVLPSLRKYIEAVKNDPPKSGNFFKVQKALNDALLNAKLNFLLSVNNELQDFLVTFQGKKPMVPFLYDQLFILLKNIGQRFIKNKTMDQIGKNEELLTLDIKDAKILKSSSASEESPNSVDIGYGTSDALKKGAKKDLDRVTFRNDCKKLPYHFICPVTHYMSI